MTADVLAFKAMSEIFGDSGNGALGYYYGDVAGHAIRSVAHKYAVTDAQILADATFKVRAAIPVAMGIRART